MNAIIGFSHLLGEDDVDSSQRDAYIDHITRNSNSLLQLMDNLIDLTLIETGNIKLNEEEVVVYSELKKIYDTYNLDRYRVNRERVALLLNVRDSFKQAKIFTDRQRLSRILSCLIENALTQTKKGVVEIGASFAEKNKMVFTVKDSSSKLLQERAKKVFENNVKQEDWYNTSDTVGLGYKLAKGLVEAMKGEIRVTDSAFNGTAIEFIISVKVISHSSENPSGDNDRIMLKRE